MLNLVNKPLLFHIIEKLAHIGIKQCDIALHHFPEKVERIIGVDSRWGIHVTHHLIRHLATPFATVLPALKHSDAECFLFGSLNTLPDFSASDFLVAPRSFNFQDRGWSGWCLLDRKTIEQIDPTMSYQALSEAGASSPVDSLFHIQTIKDLKEANQRCLSTQKHVFLFPTESREVEEGIWISRAAVIQPGVKITSPVFIGEKTQICSGVSLGPNTIVESHCILDYNASVEDALICRHSYVGENVEISASVVDRNTLINLTHQTCLSVREEFILSHSTPPGLSRPLNKIFQRLLAVILFVFFLPVYAILRIFYPVHRAEKVGTPLEASDPISYNLYSFRHLRHFSWLPTLINVIRGDLWLVGVMPRSLEEIEPLPEEWKQLAIKTKSGMITLADLEGLDSRSEDEVYASETYYAVHSGFFYDLRLFLRWLFHSG